MLSSTPLLLSFLAKSHNFYLGTFLSNRFFWGGFFFHPQLAEQQQQPIFILFYNGVQHVFIESAVAQADGFQLEAWTNPLLNAVPESIRESAPTRVHILDPSIFFGPVSRFMRKLQKEFGIESDVTLEFESIGLSVPINMSFATTSLSLAHIFAVSTTNLEHGTEAVPILTASLTVEPTNFVRQYNELVHNFKSKRSFAISSSPLKRQPSIMIDENASVKSSRSVSSSTWSQLAVRDTASIAVLSDNESLGYDEWDSFSKRSSSSSFRHGLRSSHPEERFSSSLAREPMHRSFIEDGDALSVASLDPIQTSSSRSSSSSRSFAPPSDRAAANTPTPPSSLSRKRPRVSIAEPSIGMHSGDESETTIAAAKRPKRTVDPHHSHHDSIS
jgi:hypothetical protein